MHIIFKCKTKWEIKFDNRLIKLNVLFILKEDKRINRSEIMNVIFHISDTVGSENNIVLITMPAIMFRII